MNVSEVLDSSQSQFEDSEQLHVGDKITIQKFNVKFVESVGANVAEIKTTDGARHSFGKTVVGQAKSPWWNEKLELCLQKDASDGLDAWVIEKTAEGTGSPMVALSAYPPRSKKTTED